MSRQIDGESGKDLAKVANDEMSNLMNPSVCPAISQGQIHKDWQVKRYICVLALLLICSWYVFLINYILEFTCQLFNVCLHQTEQQDLTFQFYKNLEDSVAVPKYKRYNYNMGQYLLEKKGLAKMACINCNEKSLTALKQKKYYSQLNITTKGPQQKPEWLHSLSTPYFRQSAQVDDLVATIKQFDSAKLKGFSLFWPSPVKYNQTDYALKVMLEQEIQKIGFHYHQPVSLNLRYMERGIIYIFQRQKPIFKQHPFATKSKEIGFQSVFRMTQNVPYIREWLIYHIHIGVARFYFYDNDGTAGDDEASGSFNKYTLNFNCMNMTQQKRVAMFDDIWDQFEEYIIYIPWQPTVNGKIVYGQPEAEANYLHLYENVTKYTLYTDLDEFIFSPKGLDFIEFVHQKEKEGITYFVLRHFKFQSRFCTDNKLAVESYLGWRIDGINWAKKLLVLNTASSQHFFIHWMVLKFGKEYVVESDDFRFNHYNLLQSLISFGNRLNLNNATSTHIDDSMKKYVPMLKEYCQGKCGDTYEIICPVDQRHGITKCAQLKQYIF